MSVTKRLRYEILRRDNHTCRYCGGQAPDAALTVDHVTPVALGGTDDPTNLVAACRDCNSGKSATPPGAPLVADVAQDALRWSRAMEQATQAVIRDFQIREVNRDMFLEVWDGWNVTVYDPGTKDYVKRPIPLPDDWETTIDTFMATLTYPEIREAVSIAMRNNKVTADDTFRYMCGIAWKWIAKRHEMAREILAAEEADGDPQ